MAEKDSHNSLRHALSPSATINVSVLYEILDKFHHSALIFDEDDIIIFANAHMLKAKGLTQEQMAGHKVSDPALGITTEERLNLKHKEVIAHHGYIKYEKEVTVSGSRRYFEILIVTFEVGGIVYYVYTSKNVTEARRDQQRVAELNRMLNKLIDNLPVYLFVKDVDDDLRYLIWNKAFAEYSKIPAEKVIGRTDFEVFPEYRDAQAFRDDDLRVIERGEMTQKIETYMAADGTTRMVQTYKTLVHRQDDGPLLVGISLDITDINGIERELISARMRAEESDRLKSRFLANMSHEIRTPLNAIVGFANMLSEADDEATRQTFLKIINENSELLLKLISDILDLSKIESGMIEYTPLPFDLFETCRGIAMVYKDRVPQGVELIFDKDIPGASLIINEDRNRLMQVMDNLISNAIKFTREGEIHYGFNVDRQFIEFYVSDTGIGIPVDKQNEVFDRFVKLDNFAQGTGLGLSICKLIIETLGGTMLLHSEEGRGSRFSFVLPFNAGRRDITPSDLEAPHAVAARAKSGDHTILIAEDVYSNFLVVNAMIKGRYDVIWARDGVEAVEMTREHHPDLILMDLKMPRMNGLDAAREIRAFDPDVPIVALTANAYREDRLMSEQAGMNNYLSKPVNRDAFEAILTAYLH